MKRLPPTLEKIVLSVALGLGFLFMASIFAPDFSQATPPAQPASPGSVDPHEGLAALGTIEGERYRVQVYGGASGPLYTVYERDGVEPLGVLMTQSDVGRRFPELQLDAMDFGTEPIMMAKPDQIDF